MSRPQGVRKWAERTPCSLPGANGEACAPPWRSLAWRSLRDRLRPSASSEATTITFSSDVTIEGQPLPAGTYSLFTIPSQEAWTVVFNKVAEQWGAYDYDESQDALRVQVQPTTGDHVEELTFSVEGDSVVLAWEKLRVPFKVEAGPAA